jgi:uncharacterized membrane protein YhhN
MNQGSIASWQHRARACYAALAVADTVLAGIPGRGTRRLRRLTKPLLMPSLAAATTLPALGRKRGLVRGTVAAQALSCAGDVALLRSGEGSFLAGLTAFLGAHGAYITGFATVRDRTGVPLAARTGPRAAAVTWLGLAPAMALAAGRQHRQLGVPVLVYAGALAAMVATSTVLDPRIPRTARHRIMLGTALFLASDFALATREFLLDDAPPALDAVVMATYTGAQLLIADGVANAPEHVS